MPGETHDISTREERLVVAVVLTLVLSPVLELDRSIFTRGDALESINLVALVTWCNICNVVDYLIVKLCL
jgi:hypothetical protein